MTTKTFTVRGHKIRTATTRRYVAVAVRTEDVTTERGTYVAFARVIKRSDAVATVKAEARRYGFGMSGEFAVVVDTETGEEV